MDVLMREALVTTRLIKVMRDLGEGGENQGLSGAGLMMERQNEEEEEEKRRRLFPSSKAMSLDLDMDLTTEILIRLPGKSIVRSRGVSKLWSSCTTPEWFNKSFTARSLKSPRLLIYSKQGDNLVGFSLPQDGTWDKSSYCSAVDSYVVKYPKDCDYSRLRSVHGLYYFPRLGIGLAIWNPTMRRFSILTKPKSFGWRYTIGFVGYDPIDDTYKALFMSNSGNPKPREENSNLPHVLTLGRGAKESWRVIQGSFEHVAIGCVTCINGVLYYKSFLTHDESKSRFVMSFHVGSEKFNMIQVPWKKDVLGSGGLLTYQGKLASLRSRTYDTFISLWVLEDAERHEWSYSHFALPFPLDDPISQTYLHLVGATHAGEFVYSPRKLMSPFHVLYFHPLRNSFRRVVYQGIADEEFMRRNGLGNVVATQLEAFPNHIETLMSL